MSRDEMAGLLGRASWDQAVPVGWFVGAQVAALWTTVLEVVGRGGTTSSAASAA
jgi:hypothetical protein